MSQISKALEIANLKRSRHNYKRVNIVGRAERVNYTDSKKVKVDQSLLEKNFVLPGLKDNQHIDAYKLLRTRVMRIMQQNNWNTLGITSATENEGKTLTATNLAISIAKRLNYTVVLVDADLRRPSVSKLFGINPSKGLIQYLESNTNIENIFINPGIDNFLLLPGKKTLSDRYSELLASTKMEMLVSELKSRYRSRIIIFDLPPVLAGDDVLSFTPYLDANLFVVEDGKTQADELNKSLELLEGVNILGTVLNKSSETNNTYGYY